MLDKGHCFVAYGEVCFHAHPPPCYQCGHDNALALSRLLSLSLSPYLLSLAFSSISLSTHTPAALVIFTKDGQLELEDFYDFGEDDEGWEDVDDTGESTGDGSAAGASKALMIQSDSTKAKGDYELDLFRGAKKPTTVDVRHPTLSCAQKKALVVLFVCSHYAHTSGGFSSQGSTFEIVLPSGARVGHRSLRRYYRQSFATEDNRDSVVIQKLVSECVTSPPRVPYLFVQSNHREGKRDVYIY